MGCMLLKFVYFERKALHVIALQSYTFCIFGNRSLLNPTCFNLEHVVTPTAYANGGKEQSTHGQKSSDFQVIFFCHEKRKVVGFYNESLNLASGIAIATPAQSVFFSPCRQLKATCCGAAHALWAWVHPVGTPRRLRVLVFSLRSSTRCCY